MKAKYTILLMNEVSTAGSFIGKMLEANGYQLLYSVGDKFPDSMSTEAPAVALFDLTAKAGAVLEFMRKLNMRSPGTECILLSDQVSHGAALEAVNLGAYFYLQKPYDPAQLLLAIRRAIEKRQAMEAWAENEEKQRVLMDNVKDPIMLCDPQGVFLSVNVAAAELLGITPDALIGKTLNAVHFDTAAADMERIRRVVASGAPAETEYERFLPTGARTFLSTFHPVRNARGEIIAVQVVDYDITERKQKARVTATMEQIKKTLQYLVNRSEDGVLLTDVNGAVLLANEPAAALLGKKTSELIGRPLPFPVVIGERIKLDIVRERGELGSGEAHAVETECDGRPVRLISIRDITGRALKPEFPSSEKIVS